MNIFGCFGLSFLGICVSWIEFGLSSVKLIIFYFHTLFHVSMFVIPEHNVCVCVCVWIKEAWPTAWLTGQLFSQNCKPVKWSERFPLITDLSVVCENSDSKIIKLWENWHFNIIWHHLTSFVIISNSKKSWLKIKFLFDPGFLF